MATLSADDQREELVRILQQEVECTRNLMQSLEIENEALSEHQTSALEDILQDKQENIKQLELIGHQRTMLIKSLHTQTAANDTYFDRGDYPINENDSQLIILWKELMLLAEQCQKQNRINGSIVELGHQPST